MLDPKLLRENPDVFKEATRVKRVASPETIDQWLAADDRRRRAQNEADTAKAEQNKLGAEVGRLKRELKGASSPELDNILAKSNELKSKQQTASQEQADTETEA